MSSPASSWSRMTACAASLKASSCSTSLKATLTSRPRSWCRNQRGRGYEPTIVVGRTVSTIVFGIWLLLSRGLTARLLTLPLSPHRRLALPGPQPADAPARRPEAGDELGRLVDDERDQDQASDRHLR